MHINKDELVLISLQRQQLQGDAKHNSYQFLLPFALTFSFFFKEGLQNVYDFMNNKSFWEINNNIESKLLHIVVSC